MINDELMIKHTLFLFFALCLFFSSCKKESRATICSESHASDYPVDYGIGEMCTTDVCTQYLAIWKELIQEKNDLSQEFLDTHFEFHRSDTSTWGNGITFRVCYKIEVDWVVAYNCDQFIINITADKALYPALNLPRNTNLNKEKIKIALENQAFASSIEKINNATQLEYLTMEDALNDLITFSGINTLCFSRIILNKETGNLQLEAFAEYENEENSCIKGTVDLITGEKEVQDIPCWIF